MIYPSSLIDKGNKESMFLYFSSSLCKIIGLFGFKFWLFAYVHSVSDQRQQSVVVGDIFSRAICAWQGIQYIYSIRSIYQGSCLDSPLLHEL